MSDASFPAPPNCAAGRLAAGDFTLAPGLLIRRETSVFRVVELRGKAVVIEEVCTLDRRVMEAAELLAGIAATELLVVDSEAEDRAQQCDVFAEDDGPTWISPPASLVSPPAARRSSMMLQLIDALRARGHTCLRPTPRMKLELLKVCLKLGFAEPPVEISTVYIWSLKYDRSGRALGATTPRYADRGGRGGSRIAAPGERAINHVIGLIEQDPTRKIIFTECREDVRVVLTAELKEEAKVTKALASLSTVTRRMKDAFPQRAIDKRGLDKRSTDEQYRNVYGRHPSIFALQDVEFDDKDSRVYLLDRRSGLPAGRGFLTGGVCRNSDMPLGFEISDKFRSVWSAKSCLLKCILPKDPRDPQFALAEHDFPYYGLMLRAHFDNAIFNHAGELYGAVSDAKIIPGYTRAGQPTDKEAIERLWANVDRGYLQHLPGYAGRKRGRGHAEGIARAVMFEDDFVQGFWQWICDKYVLRPSGDGKSPRQKWEEGTRLIKPHLPVDIRRLQLLAFMQYAKPLKLRPEGLLFMGLPYQCDHLIELKYLLGSSAPLAFLYHPKMLESIRVMDTETRKFFVVPISPPYRKYVTHLSLLNHRLIRKKLRNDGSKNPDLRELVDGRVAHYIATGQLRLSRKIRERHRALQQTDEGYEPDISSPEEVSADVKPNKEYVSDLEAHVQELEEIELEDTDPDWAVPASL